jgi:hypothetical protein
MKRILTLPKTKNTKAILATWIVVSAMCTCISEATAARPPATPNPFAGTYCGYLVGQNYGSMSISDSGDVTGYFSFFFPTFSESYRLSGRVNAEGVMRLKVVHSYTVRGRRTPATERYSVTVTVALDSSGNLVATSGASFVLSHCQ